jgi:hypothetical protein
MPKSGTVVFSQSHSIAYKFEGLSHFNAALLFSDLLASKLNARALKKHQIMP